MTITSTAFQQDEEIPAEYGYTGKNVNPPLTFSEVPRDAKSLLLTLEDPDATAGPSPFTHWLVYNISPAALQVLEGGLPIGAQEATNDFGQIGYGGPKPPSGTHHYVFKLFALDKTLDEVMPATKSAEIYKTIEGHVIDQCSLVGLFSA